MSNEVECDAIGARLAYIVTHNQIRVINLWYARCSKSSYCEFCWSLKSQRGDFPQKSLIPTRWTIFCISFISLFFSLLASWCCFCDNTNIPSNSFEFIFCEFIIDSVHWSRNGVVLKVYITGSVIFIKWFQFIWSLFFNIKKKNRRSVYILKKLRKFTFQSK